MNGAHALSWLPLMLTHGLHCVCRPFAQRYAILLANGRGAYQPLDLDSMEQRQLAEAVRRILQAAGLDGWQVSFPPFCVSFCVPKPIKSTAAGPLQLLLTGNEHRLHKACPRK